MEQQQGEVFGRVERILVEEERGLERTKGCQGRRYRRGWSVVMVERKKG